MSNKDIKEVKSKAVVKRKPNSALIHEPEHTFKKHIGLINISVAKLSLSQQKLYNAVLHLTRQQLQDDPARNVFEITSKDIQAYCNNSENRLRQLDKDFKQLQQTLIETVNIREDLDISEFHRAQLIGRTTVVQRISNRELLRFQYTIDKVVRDTLLNPKIFASLNLKKLSLYKSSYAYALDPILRVNFNLVNFSKRISLEDYRALVGVPDGRFEGRNDNLYVYAVKNPLKLIHEKCPELRNIHSRAVKRGKNVVAIEFYAKKEKVNISTFKELDDLFHQYSFKEEEIIKLVSSYEHRYIYDVLSYSYKMYLKNKDTENHIQDLKKYALTCLARKIDVSKTLFEEEDAVSKNNEINELPLNKKYLYIDALKNEHDVVLQSLCKRYYDDLENIEKQKLFDKIEDDFDKQQLFQLNWSLENGFEDPITEGYFNDYILQQGYIDFNYSDFPTYVLHTYGVNIILKNNGFLFKDSKSTKLQITIDDTEVKSENPNDLIIDAVIESPPESEIVEELSLNKEHLLELDNFLLDYKKEAALILLNDKAGSIYKKQYTANIDDPVDQIVENMVNDPSLFSFTVEDICEQLELILVKSPTLKLRKNQKVIAEEAMVIIKLYALLPKDSSAFASLMLK